LRERIRALAAEDSTESGRFGFLCRVWTGAGVGVDEIKKNERERKKPVTVP
jgi:hypothetical protein